jgi:hypothetical protein
MRRIRIKKFEEQNGEQDVNPEELNEEIKEDNLEFKNYKPDIISKLYNFLITFCNYFLKTIKLLLKVSGIYLLWICLHYFSAHLYIKFCVPDTIIGFLMSPFMIATPHCQGLRWIVYNAAGIINNMWILIGAWIYSMIWIFKSDNAVDAASI